MIEFPITLTSGGSVCMPGYVFALALGYTKNLGVYRLHVDATGEWEGLTIRCFWHVPDGKDPSSSLVVDGYVDVPASVTAQPGSGCITFEGSDDTKNITSADLHYRVSANSGTEDGTEPEPGTPAWQQFVDAVKSDAAAAQQAKTDAQTAAQQAGASVKKAGQALSDTISAKENALKAIGDKQTTATQAVDTARDKALQQVEASTEAAQTAASEAATSAGNASQSAQKAADSLQELKDGIANGDFKGEPGNDGKSPVVTVADIENGHRVSITDKDGTKTIDVLNGQTGKTGATPVLTIGTVSSGDKPSADITGTPENPVLNLMLQPGPQGPAVALDTTLTHEGEAADAKATGDAISAVKARQNILIGTETGNPLCVDDAFAAPLCGLTVYGRSTQDGTPTPDAPVPIVSAGDGGSVAVKVTGKNILDMRNSKESATNSGVTYIRNADYSFTRTGTAADTTGNVWPAGGYMIKPNADLSNVFCVLLKGVKYSIKDCVLFTISLTGGPLTAQGQNFVPVQDMYITGVRNENFIAGKTYNDTVYPAVYVGAKVLPYSPYREQLLTLPTPNGLPGIPVTSGGNYTDSTGQQWVCDEVDLERGVKVQRINRLKLDDLSWRYELTPTNKSDTFISDVPASQDGTTRGYSLCQYAVFDGVAYDIEMKESCRCYVWIKSVTLQFKAGSGVNSVDAFSEWLKARPDASISYCLATPIETPLTPDEIAAYKALTAYGPDTVVQAGDGAGVKLEYQRDVNIAIKKLEDAIASMTTT